MSCLLVVWPPSFRTCAVDNRFPMGTCTPPHARGRDAPLTETMLRATHCCNTAPATPKKIPNIHSVVVEYSQMPASFKIETNTMAGAPRSNDTRGKFDLRALQCQDAPPTDSGASSASTVPCPARPRVAGSCG